MSTEAKFSPPPVSAFECVVCGYESGAAGTCPHCEAPLFDQRNAEPWQLEARKRRVSHIPNALSIIAEIYTFLVAMFVATIVAGRPGALSLLAFLLLRKLWRRWFAEHAVAQRKARASHRSVAETVTASKAVDGDRVRVSGAAVLRCPALGYDDTRAIARDDTLCASVIDGYSRYSNAKTLVTCVQTGGEFTLQSPDGTTIRVRLDHFVLLSGERTKDATIIPEGAIVTVSGLARWTTDEERSGLRSIGRTLELTGTEKEPIVIEAVPLEKWIDQQKITENAITTGVRIGANNSSADRAESESSTAEVRFDEAPTGVQKHR